MNNIQKKNTPVVSYNQCNTNFKFQIKTFNKMLTENLAERGGRRGQAGACQA
jgi:hypothetical protein